MEESEVRDYPLIVQPPGNRSQMALVTNLHERTVCPHPGDRAGEK